MSGYFDCVCCLALYILTLREPHGAHELLVEVVEGVFSECVSVCVQVPGPMLKQMPSPGSGVGGVGGVGAGVFPPQLSPQQIAVLSNIYPHVQQFHLVSRFVWDPRLASVHNPLRTR